MAHRTLIALALLFAVALAPLAVDDVTCSGKPNFAALESKGYFLWRDQGGWHLRWVTKGQRHDFAGTIASDGPFVTCEGTEQGSSDAVVLASPEVIRFDSRSSGGVKGLDFAVDHRATKISFNLQMDGQAVPADLVRLGFRGVRPEGVPFRVELRPSGLSASPRGE
jgi:hypothetical protein